MKVNSGGGWEWATRGDVWVSRERDEKKMCIYLFECLVYWLEFSSFSVSPGAQQWVMCSSHCSPCRTDTNWLLLIPLVLLDPSHCPSAVLWGSSQNHWRKAAAAQNISDRLLIRLRCMRFCSQLYPAPSASNHLTVLCWCCTGSDERSVCFCEWWTQTERVEREGGEQGTEKSTRRV